MARCEALAELRATAHALTGGGVPLPFARVDMGPHISQEVTERTSLSLSTGFRACRSGAYVGQPTNLASWSCEVYQRRAESLVLRLRSGFSRVHMTQLRRSFKLLRQYAGFAGIKQVVPAGGSHRPKKTFSALPSSSRERVWTRRSSSSFAIRFRSCSREMSKRTTSSRRSRPVDLGPRTSRMQN